MGCASTPVPNTEQKQTPDAKLVNHCDKSISRVDDNYPWSIPGYHDTLTKQPAPFSITQTTGEPDQFIICSDCPCVTPKSVTKDKWLKKNGKKNKKGNPKKLVIRFEPASYVLSRQQQQLLKRSYQSLPDQYQLMITGYTDNTIPGGSITNESLALQRATVVFDFLVGLGIDESKTIIKASPLCCYVAPNTTDSGRALNRRVEIVINSLSINRKNP